VLTESSSVFQKKTTGLTRGLHISKRRPQADSQGLPRISLSSSRALTEEGRPIGKAKKAKTKETDLLSSSDHGTSYYLFFEKSQPSIKFILFDISHVFV